MPRKKKEVTEETVVETKEESVTEEPKEEVTEETRVKKKRGRPKKETPKEEKVYTEDGADASPEPEPERVSGELIPTSKPNDKPKNVATWTDFGTVPKGAKTSKSLSGLYTEMEYEDWIKEREEDEYRYVQAYQEGAIDFKRLDELVRATHDHSMTPSQYFKALKELRTTSTPTEIGLIINAAHDKIKKYALTGQKKLAEETIKRTETLIKEMNAIKAGYTSFINTADFDAWVLDIENVGKKDRSVLPIRVVETSKYMRDIPDEVFEKFVDAKPYFEKFYIAFTDYTGETERQVKQEERDKDPILFGTFEELKPSGKLEPGPHLFFIDDWIDEYCDLTFTQLLERTAKDTGKELLIPDTELILEDIERAKELLNSK